MHSNSTKAAAQMMNRIQTFKKHLDVYKPFPRNQKKIRNSRGQIFVRKLANDVQAQVLKGTIQC